MTTDRKQGIGGCAQQLFSRSKEKKKDPKAGEVAGGAEKRGEESVGGGLREKGMQAWTN